MVAQIVDDPEEFTIDPDRPVYSMGVTSELVGVPLWTLRTLYEQGMVGANRKAGTTRLYSLNDLKMLIRIRALLKKGLNVAGIKLVIGREDSEKK